MTDAPAITPGMYWGRSSPALTEYDAIVVIRNRREPYVGMVWFLGTHLTQGYGPGQPDMELGPRIATVTPPLGVRPSRPLWSDDACRARLDKLMATPDVAHGEFWRKLRRWVLDSPDREWAGACYDKLDLLYRAELVKHRKGVTEPESADPILRVV